MRSNDTELLNKSIIILGQKIRINMAGLTEDVISRLKHKFSFDNPKYWRHLQQRRNVNGIPQKITCFWEDGNELLVPKGGADMMRDIFHLKRVPFGIELDEPLFPKVSFNFYGTLFNGQKSALNEMGNRRFGVLIGPVGSGKKVVALFQAAQRKLPTLIVVKSRNRFLEWREAISRFLRIKDGEIGLIGDGQHRIGDKVTIAIDRSLYQHLDDIRDKIGFVIIDRCEIANLKVFFKAVGALNPKCILGLARDYRRPDRLSGVMRAYLGPPLATMEIAAPVLRINSRVSLKVHQTGFKFDFNGDYGELISALTCNDTRNQMIVEDILQVAAEDKSRVMVISNRIEHLELFQKMLLESYMPAVGIVSSKTSDKERRHIMDRFKRRKLRIILTTMKSLASMKELSYTTLILATPCRYDVSLILAIKELTTRGKCDDQSIVYEYADEPGVLKALLKERVQGYRRLGFGTTVSASPYWVK